MYASLSLFSRLTGPLWKRWRIRITHCSILEFDEDDIIYWLANESIKPIVIMTVLQLVLLACYHFVCARSDLILRWSITTGNMAAPRKMTCYCFNSGQRWGLHGREQVDLSLWKSSHYKQYVSNVVKEIFFVRYIRSKPTRKCTPDDLTQNVHNIDNLVAVGSTLAK